jgi:hypothetical protein
VSLLIGHGACDTIQKISGTFDSGFKSFVRLTALGREFTQSNEFSDFRTNPDTSFLSTRKAETDSTNFPIYRSHLELASSAFGEHPSAHLSEVRRRADHVA